MSPPRAFFFGHSRRLFVAATVATTLLGNAACGTAVRKARPLAPYEKEQTQIFDDTIDAAAVGLDINETFDPSSDPNLDNRVRQADSIMRARVLTVSSRGDIAKPTFQLSLQTQGEAFTERKAIKSPFQLRIDSTSPSAGIVKHLESGLIGKTFIVFVREFVRADGDTELHFHISPDTKLMTKALQDASARTQ